MTSKRHQTESRLIIDGDGEINVKGSVTGPRPRGFRG